MRSLIRRRLAQRTCDRTALYSRRNHDPFARASATDSNFARSRSSSRTGLWNNSVHPFSHGLLAATAIGSVPTPGSQSTSAVQSNSEPVSLRFRPGARAAR